MDFLYTVFQVWWANPSIRGAGLKSETHLSVVSLLPDTFLIFHILLLSHCPNQSELKINNPKILKFQLKFSSVSWQYSYSSSSALPSEINLLSSDTAIPVSMVIFQGWWCFLDLLIIFLLVTSCSFELNLKHFHCNLDGFAFYALSNLFYPG